MARTHKDPDGVSKVIDLFPAGSQKAVERLLKRARERETREAGRSVKAAGRTLRLPTGGLARLTRELGRALTQRGAKAGRASIRQVSPQSGGRPFHFAHSVVSKGDAPAPAGTKARKAGGGGGSGGGDAVKGAGRAAAHMRYIEREMAVEALYGQGDEREAPGQDGRAMGGREDGRDDGHGRDHADGRASTGQAYVEDGAKLENGERIAFSFGTIGTRFEDRVRFWEALEEAEAHPRARVQHRLIVELPHEATREARFEIVRRFCERFEADGIPFWAALHAPGEKNDARNFHAHIVYSERPARRVPHPDRPGEETWDFEVVRSYVKKSRNVVKHRPLRQDKLRAYHAKDFIKTRRTEFAKIVNEVLTQGAVKGRDGKPVLYDARTYAAMGVDAVPMRSINRIVADRARDGATTVLDRDYTGRMIAAELREAGARRDRDVLELVALDDTIRAATAPAPKGKGAAEGARPPPLPRELQGPNLRSVPRALLRAAGDRIMSARHEALRTVVMERATTAALERVIEATAPEAVAAAVKGAGRTRPKPGELALLPPDGAAARLLREAALEELAEVRREAEKARRTAKFRVDAAVQAWRDLVEAPLTTTSATTRRGLLGLDAEERRDETGLDEGWTTDRAVDAANGRGCDAVAGLRIAGDGGPAPKAREAGAHRQPAGWTAESAGGTRREAAEARTDGVAPTTAARAASTPRAAPSRAAQAPAAAATSGGPRPTSAKAEAVQRTDGAGARGAAPVGGVVNAFDPLDPVAAILSGSPALLEMRAQMSAMLSGIAEATEDPSERLEMVKSRIAAMGGLLRAKRQAVEGSAVARGVVRDGVSAPAPTSAPAPRSAQATNHPITSSPVAPPTVNRAPAPSAGQVAGRSGTAPIAAEPTETSAAPVVTAIAPGPAATPGTAAAPGPAVAAAPAVTTGGINALKPTAISEAADVLEPVASGPVASSTALPPRPSSPVVTEGARLGGPARDPEVGAFWRPEGVQEPSGRAQYEVRPDAPLPVAPRPGKGGDARAVGEEAGAGAGAPAEPVEDPDDARRRRVHDEEEAKRKKRKAVLGRRNRSMDRGR